MRTIETTVYQFDELNEAGKEKARQWWSEASAGDEWWESIYDDAESVGLKITGFDLDRNRHATGEFRCFGGAEQCANLILKEHGDKCETFKTATQYLKDLQKLNVEIESVDGDDETNCEYEVWQDKRMQLASEFEQSLLQDYVILLRDEYEYRQTAEYIDECIRCNEYEFNANGKRV